MRLALARRARFSSFVSAAGRRFSFLDSLLLRAAHWGMYASGALDLGVQYNDEIRICTLSKPLADLAREPRCAPDSIPLAGTRPVGPSAAP